MKITSTTKGFIALTTVLILSAVFLLVSVGLVTLAISSGQNNLSTQMGRKAQIYADSCVEYALVKLQQSSDYSGNEAISFGEDSCEILEIGGAGNNNRIIQATSNVSEFVHRVEVQVEAILPSIVITSWESVVEF